MCKRKHTRVIMAVSSPAAGDKSQQDTKGEGQSVFLYKSHVNSVIYTSRETWIMYGKN